MAEDDHDDVRADDAVARLRASDPAATAEPDTERLDRLTTERRGDELAARRDRRPRRWAAVAAIAAGAVVVGGVGYGLGSAAPDADERADGQATIAQRSAQDTAGAAPEPGMLPEIAAAPRSLSLAHGGQRTVFTSSGLSSDTATARVWAFDGAAAYDAATVARAADVLGVSGDPVERHGGWFVGADDGSGPMAEMGSDGALNLFYNDPELHELTDHAVEPMPMPAPEGRWSSDESAPGTTGDDGEGAPDSTGDGAAGAAGDDDAAPEPTAVGPDEPVQDTPTAEPGTGSGSEPAEPGVVEPAEPVEPEPAPEPVDAGDLTGEGEVLHGVLTELGLDADGAEYVVQPALGEDVMSVTAYQLLDGRRTGYQWNAMVVADRVYSFSGPLAPVVDLGEYDVVSPVEAVDRLGDPRFGGSQVGSQGIAVLPHTEGPEGWSWGDPPGAPPAAGAAIPWAVTDVSIVEADLALTQQTTDTGTVLLLPAYELSDADGRTWSVLAVADHELAF